MTAASELYMKEITGGNATVLAMMLLGTTVVRELSIREQAGKNVGILVTRVRTRAVVAGKFIIQRQSPVVAEPSWKKIFGDHATGSVTITGMSPAATERFSVAITGESVGWNVTMP